MEHFPLEGADVLPRPLGGKLYLWLLWSNLPLETPAIILGSWIQDCIQDAGAPVAVLVAMVLASLELLVRPLRGTVTLPRQPCPQVHLELRGVACFLITVGLGRI